ncbi:hypothetical protein HGRIS_000229 [Hohenbuehelia grisea]|uniref:F-box domain-containing protein n=1 Tax=Hohenbuehelia grisea TaxID=104357 RepID=A0ABR3JRS7_9AGAR
MYTQTRELTSFFSVMPQIQQNTAAATATIRSLPGEILSEIFMHAVGCPKVFDVKCFPWTLGHVSSSWRSITLSTPQLWRYIHIRRTCLGPYARPVWMEILQEWIKRSGECLLSVVIEDDYGGDFPREAIELITAHSRRWVTASIEAYLAHRGDLEVIRGNIPALQEIQIHMDEMMEENFKRHTTITNCFQIAPRLRVVYTNYALYHFLPMPTDNLVDLATNIRSNLEIYELLRPCADRLVRVNLHNRTPFAWTNEMPPANAPRLLLSAIESIQLQTDGKVLDMLTVPQLKSLSIDAFIRVPETGLFPVSIGPSINSLISRSKCPLISLSIGSSKMSSAELISALAALPLLESLSLSDPHGLDSTFFIPITYAPGTTLLLPRLESFRFGWGQLENHVNFSPDLTLNFLESRLHPDNTDNQIQPLRKAHLILPRKSIPMSSPQNTRFEALTADYKVTIIWSPCRYQ